VVVVDAGKAGQRSSRSNSIGESVKGESLKLKLAENLIRVRDFRGPKNRKAVAG